MVTPFLGVTWVAPYKTVQVLLERLDGQGQFWGENTSTIAGLLCVSVLPGSMHGLEGAREGEVWESSRGNREVTVHFLDGSGITTSHQSFDSKFRNTGIQIISNLKHYQYVFICW